MATAKPVKRFLITRQMRDAAYRALMEAAHMKAGLSQEPELIDAEDTEEYRAAQRFKDADETWLYPGVS